jgi:hypothetical protein
MRVRADSPAGPEVPSPDRAVELLRDHLAAQQTVWAEKLAGDPGSLAQREPQVHDAFARRADQLVARLRAHAARQPTRHAQAQKK